MFEIVWEITKTWHKVLMMWADAVGKIVLVHLLNMELSQAFIQSVNKKTPAGSVKCNKAKYHKMRYACMEVSKLFLVLNTKCEFIKPERRTPDWKSRIDSSLEAGVHSRRNHKAAPKHRHLDWACSGLGVLSHPDTCLRPLRFPPADPEGWWPSFWYLPYCHKGPIHWASPSVLASNYSSPEHLWSVHQVPY